MIRGILALVVIGLTIVVTILVYQSSKVRRKLLEASTVSQDLCAGCFKPLRGYVERCTCGVLICTDCQECAVCADPIFKETSKCVKLKN